MRRQRNWKASATRWLGIVVAYLCVDFVLNRYAIGLGWTILWPLNGMTVALLLRKPRRYWPMLLLAVELGTLGGECLDGGQVRVQVVERAWSAMEVLICAFLLPSFRSVEEWLAEPAIVRRVGAALVLGPGISGVFAAIDAHLRGQGSLLAAWNWWATPDMLGIAVTLPVSLALLTPEARALFDRAEWRKTLPTLGLSLAVAALIFSSGAYPLLFLLYPMLLYVDSELSFAGASLAIFFTSVLGVFCTVHGLGPFGHWSPELRLSRQAALQIYLGFHALALLPLSLVILERRTIAEKLKEANARLLDLAQQDALTGIANRRAFDEGLGAAWERAMERGEPLSLLMIDIDRFKQFNDLHGHLEGDRCLRRVAQLLSGAARWDENRVARFGGEEFAVLLPNSDATACFRMAEKLRKAVVAAAIPHEGSSWGLVTISIGCATLLPAPGMSGRELIAQADAALYRAKAHGRNRLDSPLTHTVQLMEAMPIAAMLPALS